jgi:membrane-associated PAP2 superfamily phosphatase
VENSYRQFASINLFGLVVSGLLFAYIAHSGTFDFWVSQHFFDPVANNFPMEKNRTLFFLGHTVLKKITVVGWILCIPLAIASTWVQRLRPWRGALWTFVVMAGATAQLVQSLKGASVHACPYDLAMYGGKEMWFPLFDAVANVVHKGQCWPGGHASAGFGIIAGYFALRTQQPRWARWALITGLVLGSVMGAVQVVRGAHFISHNLWSLWLTWAMCFAIDAAMHVVRTVRRQNATSATSHAVPLPGESITAESAL